MSTCWRCALSAATSWLATWSLPARISVRGSPLTMVFESARSFWLKVSRAASTTARNVWKPASVGLTSKVTRVTPASSWTGWVATSAPSAKSRTVAAWATDERISAIAWTDSPSRAIDGVVSRSTSTSSTLPSPIAFVSMRIPRARRERRLGRPAAGRVVAVAEEDDPLLRVVGEERGGEAQRGADVGGALDRRRGDAVDVLELGREPLHERVLAERDDPRDIALRLVLEGLAQEGEGLAAARVADRVRQVDDEHRREPVDRQHQLEPRDREDQGAEQDRADDQRGPAAPRAHPPPGGEVEADGQRERRGQQQEPERLGERDAHQAVPPSGRRRSAPDSERRTRITASRW